MSSTLAHSPIPHGGQDASDVRPSPPTSALSSSPQGPSPRSAQLQHSPPVATTTAKTLFEGDTSPSRIDEPAARRLDRPEGDAPSSSLHKATVSVESAQRRSPVLSRPQAGQQLVSSPPNSGRDDGSGVNGTARLVPFLKPAPPTPTSPTMAGGARRSSQPQPPLRDTMAQGRMESNDVSASVHGSRRPVVRQLNGVAAGTGGAAHHPTLAPPSKPDEPSATTTTAVTPSSAVSTAAGFAMPPVLPPRRNSLAGSVASSSASSATSSARQSFRRNVLTLHRYGSGVAVSDAMAASVASSISTNLTSLSPSLQPIAEANGAPLSSRSGAAPSLAAASDGAGSVVSLSGEGSLVSRHVSGSSFTGTRRTFRRTTTPRPPPPARASGLSSRSDNVAGGASAAVEEDGAEAKGNNSNSSSGRGRHSGANNAEMHSFLRHQYMILQRDATGHLENTTASARRTSAKLASGATGGVGDDRSPSGAGGRPRRTGETARTDGAGGSAHSGAGDAELANFTHVRRSDCPQHSKAARAALERKLEEERLLALQRQHHYEKIIINGGHEQVDPTLKKSTSLASALTKQQKKRQTLRSASGGGGSLTRSASSLYNSMVITSAQVSDGEASDDDNPALAATTGGIAQRRADGDRVSPSRDSPVIYGSMYGTSEAGEDENEFSSFVEDSATPSAATAAWQRSSARSLYGHGGSGSGDAQGARPRSASLSQVHTTSSRPRRFSLDTMSLAQPQKSSAAVMPRAQSVSSGGEASGLAVVRKITEFTVPLGQDSSSDEEDGGKGWGPTTTAHARAESAPPCAPVNDPYGPQTVTSSAETRHGRSGNSVRQGGELKSYNVRGSKRAGDDASKPGQRAGSRPPVGYGYGYGLDDDSDSDDHCFSFYSHRTRIKPVRGNSQLDKRGGDEDDEDAAAKSLPRVEESDGPTRAATVATPQSRRSTIPFSEETPSLSATLSGRQSGQSLQPDGAERATAGTNAVAEKDRERRPSATSATIAASTENDDDDTESNDPQACCHCCPCRRPENFHLLLRKRSGSGSGEVRAAQPSSTAALSTSEARKSSQSFSVNSDVDQTAAGVLPSPQHHQQLFVPAETGDDTQISASEISVEPLAALTGPSSQNTSLEPTGGASPPPYTVRTAAATPSTGTHSPAHAAKNAFAGTPLHSLGAPESGAALSSDEDDEDAPVLSIQSFRRSSSRNIKRLGSSADVSPL